MSPMLRRIGRCFTAATLTLVASCSMGGLTSDRFRGGSATAASVGSMPVVAPYLDVTQGTDALINNIAAITGQKDYTLGFLLAQGATCVPSWGGTRALDDKRVMGEIAAITAAGGQAIVSSGGTAGTYLESVCTADQLAKAYEQALDTSASNALDIDIVKPVTTSILFKALLAVQQLRGTAITLTLPVSGTTGLSDNGYLLLQEAKQAGIDFKVNVMVLDFQPEFASDWATSMTTAVDAVRSDVAAVWPDLKSSAVSGQVGVTPMIGVNDNGGITTLDGARQLLDYARKNKLGFVRFWSVNRDNGDCPMGRVASGCSGIAQDDYAFTKLFSTYQK